MSKACFTETDNAISCASFFVDNEQFEGEHELFIDGKTLAWHEPYLPLYDKPVQFGRYAVTFAKVLAWSIEYMKACYPDFTKTGFEFLNLETLLLVGKTQHGDVAALVSFAILRTWLDTKTAVVIAEPIVGAFVQLEPGVIAIVSDTVTVRLLARSVLQPEILKNEFLRAHDPILMTFNELITLADVNPKLVTNKPELKYDKFEWVPPAKDRSFYTLETVFNTAEEFERTMNALTKIGLSLFNGITLLYPVVLRYPATEVLQSLELLERYQIACDFETHSSRYRADCEVYSYEDLVLITITDSLYAYGKPHLIMLEAGMFSIGRSPLYLNTQDKLVIVVSAKDYAKEPAKLKGSLTKKCLKQMLDRHTHWFGLLHKHRGMDEDYSEFECMEMMLGMANQID